MTNPFYTAANAVIAKFHQRMTYTQPERAQAEMQTAKDLLEQLADIARYTGDDSAAYIHLTVNQWTRTGRTPAPFRGY